MEMEEEDGEGESEEREIFEVEVEVEEGGTARGAAVDDEEDEDGESKDGDILDLEDEDGEVREMVGLEEEGGKEARVNPAEGEEEINLDEDAVTDLVFGDDDDGDGGVFKSGK